MREAGKVGLKGRPLNAVDSAPKPITGFFGSATARLPALC